VTHIKPALCTVAARRSKCPTAAIAAGVLGLRGSSALDYRVPVFVDLGYLCASFPEVLLDRELRPLGRGVAVHARPSVEQGNCNHSYQGKCRERHENGNRKVHQDFGSLPTIPELSLPLTTPHASHATAHRPIKAKGSIGSKISSGTFIAAMNKWTKSKGRAPGLSHPSPVLARKALRDCGRTLSHGSYWSRNERRS